MTWFGCGVLGLGFWVGGSGCGVWGSGCGVQGVGFGGPPSGGAVTLLGGALPGREAGESPSCRKRQGGSATRRSTKVSMIPDSGVLCYQMCTIQGPKVNCVRQVDF